MSGIISSGIGFGMFLFPPLANWLISRFGWRVSYVIMGIATTAVMLISAQFLRKDPGQKGLSAFGASTTDIKSDSGTQGYSLKEALRTRQFWIIGMTFFTTNLCTQLVVVHIVPHATDIGIELVAAATIISAIGLISICSKIGSGAVIDKLGSKPVMIGVTVLMSLSFLWLLPSDRLWMFYIFALIFAAGYGGSSSIQSPIVAECFGLKAHGTIMGILMVGTYAGGALGPALAGSLFDFNGSYRWAFILCIAISFTAFTGTLLLKSTRKKE
jgi:MFS family permease